MKRCCSIVLFTLMAIFEVKAKSLVFNKYGTSPYYGARRPSYDMDFDEMQDQSSDVFGYKRSIDGGIHPFKRSIFGSTRKRSPYGLVYNQGKPIGILEPIGQAFEYASYPAPRDVNLRNTGFKSQWYPTKRESTDLEMDDLERADDELGALHSSNYANVLAKFKVNNKVKHRPYRDFLCAQQVKRNAFSEDVAEDGNQDHQFDPAALVSSVVSASSFSNPTSSLLEETSSDLANKKREGDELKKRGALNLGDLTSDQKQDEEQVVKIDSGLKSSSKVKRKAEEKIGDVDDNLKEVMDDLNFIEKDGSEQQKDEKIAMKKREIYFEDEDLENGLNKIGLTKESHFDRNKKEDTPLKTKIVTKSLKNIKKTKVEKSIHRKGKKKARKDSDEPKQRIVKSPKRLKGNNYNNNRGSKINKIANYQSAGEEYLRKKRQTAKDEKAERGDSEIMKGLEEASGDLTVSGNKSPLVAVSNDEIEKKSQEKRDKEELEYEKRLERNIEEKINAIKEEVKREISRLQSDDEDVDDPQRKKREITNNLMECESSILDPGENIEEDLEPHIRKRRGTEINNNKNKMHPVESEEEKTPKELEENSAINSNEEIKSNSEESMINNRQEVANDEAESKEKSLIKRASKSVPELKEEKEEEEDKESSDEDDETERETSMIKRNQKKEREKERKKIAKEDMEENEEDKNVDKRDAEIQVTEKIENNGEEDASTENINKRNDIDVSAKEQTEINAVIADANTIVKRNEEEQTTNKFIIPRAGIESTYEEEEENRQERSIKEKDVKNFNNQKESKGKEENLIKNTDNISKRDQRSPDESSSKPITHKEIKEKQQKRSTNEAKETIPELEKPAASKSVILNEQELGKENQVEERSAAETEETKELPINNQEKSNLNQDSSQTDKEEIKEESNEVNQNVKKLAEEDETSYLESKEKQNDNSDVKRKRRSLYNEMLKRSSRKKRDGSWSDSDSVGYRAEDGEIDEEDDEMQDDGFDDQTSNLVNKRNEYEDVDGPDYPTYMERNKRNALRLYDDEVGEDESFDNFLFYPKKYSRVKRYDNLGDNVVRTRNKRRKRREEELTGRLRGDAVEKNDITELSEADIFGGLPQSYEGELSRFKRVKRSRDTEK
ncbi:golgin subfamily A member 6-like protein 25 isoform X1 [Onthophagus taurus]|uniref:golgin subfamily A member 6-like protein 25 isoform X1 n=1 Tax=Onthophagus taurus TaxID=166361 RepID=UPI0039BE8C30